MWEHFQCFWHLHASACDSHTPCDMAELFTSDRWLLCWLHEPAPSPYLPFFLFLPPPTYLCICHIMCVRACTWAPVPVFVHTDKYLRVRVWVTLSFLSSKTFPLVDICCVPGAILMSAVHLALGPCVLSARGVSFNLLHLPAIIFRACSAPHSSTWPTTPPVEKHKRNDVNGIQITSLPVFISQHQTHSRYLNVNEGDDIERECVCARTCVFKVDFRLLFLLQFCHLVIKCNLKPLNVNCSQPLPTSISLTFNVLVYF